VSTSVTTSWLEQAAEQFNKSAHRTDGAEVATCLSYGLTILRESLYVRVSEDVEKNVGKDSMLAPVSQSEAERHAIEEIELYQAAESALFAKNARYLNRTDDWYLPWLVRLRLADHGWREEFAERSEAYLPKGEDARRLAFMDALAHVLPESREAPLVLFRLVPLSVQIATARAFGDRTAAARLRREQTTVLPAIVDCRQCRAQVLECVEQCRACGNPLWKYEWLTAAD
jgi:hypothetical protein